MTAREQVLSLLQGAEASRIRFTFPGGGGAITIAPATFHRVARAIRRGDIRVTPTTTFPTGVAGRVADGLLRQYQLGTPGIPAVDPVEWGRLRLIVVTTPIYIFPNLGNVGAANQFTPGPVVTGASYTHNG